MTSGTEAPGPSVQPVALDRGTEMLATFLALMPDAAVAVDGEGKIVAVNERTETFFGYAAGELEGKPIELLVPERFRHNHRRQRSSYSAEPRARPMGSGLDLYARRRDGTEFPVDISLAPIGEGEDQLVVAAVRDISERKASQSAQAQLAAIVQSTADGIFSMTQAGVVTSWNPAAETVFGYPRSEVVGRHFSQFFPDDPVLEELLDSARSNRSSLRQDTRWPTRDGSMVDVAISVSPLAGNDDAGYSVIIRDIRVRKAAEALLRQQARWQTATAEIRLSLLSEGALDASLELVCKWAVELSGAGAAAVVVAEGPRVRVDGSAGDSSALAALSAHVNAVAGVPLGRAVSLGDGLEARAFPIEFPKAEPQRSGALVVAGPKGAAPEASLEEVLGSLASQAALAFELANIRADRDRLLISADRERIARDLHDLVIQRLFGAGLRLQGAMGLIDNQAAASRVSSTIDDLDTTIKEIREAIFALESAPGMGMRAKVLEAAADASEALGFRPAVSFHGLADREIALHVQVEAAAVLREALSNAARHAHASRVQVDVTVDDELSIIVTDNGVGLGEPQRQSGLANARARAELLGGLLRLSDAPGGGTCFEWRVPLSPIN